MIEGVRMKRLTVHSDDRGLLMEVLRADDPSYVPVKQTTYTEAYPEVIKAFHWHRRQWDLWFFASGTAQVVLYDLRPESATHRQTDVVIMGERAPILLAIPIGVAHGYRVLGTRPAGLFYHTSEVYDPADPDEERLPHDDPTIGFDWTTRPR
jgi:dTDP-4-dehydrorhamnose 3,5-epimerase